MKIYDSSLRAKVDFEPLRPGKVSMYVCGPTVYDQIHIGNGRTFLSFDVIRRWLIAKGYEVTMAQNLTDVDDKIIKRANETGSTADEVARTYADAFIHEMDRFGVLPPDIRPRATEEIPGMIEMISELVASGHAYVSGGDVYFSVRSDESYGHVSNRDVDSLLSGARIESGEEKRDPLDFALWKAAKPGEPTWDSPWGPGRPGWHTECAVMVHRYLGMPIDIHGGGSDLAFPHHENESAQAECCWGGAFSNHWMHTGMLRVDGEKMSKSLGNFYTLKEVLDEYPAEALRLLMLQTHYRSPLDFSYERLQGSVGSLERIRTAVKNLAWAQSHASQPPAGQIVVDAAADHLIEEVGRAREEFAACMDDDFNTAGALAAVFGLVSTANTYLDEAGSQGRAEALAAAANAIVELLAILGIDVSAEDPAADLPSGVLDLAHEQGCYAGDDLQAAAQALVECRQQARAQRDWARADAIRDSLAELGLVIEDTPQGPRVHRS